MGGSGARRSFSGALQNRPRRGLAAGSEWPSEPVRGHLVWRGSLSGGSLDPSGRTRDTACRPARLCDAGEWTGVGPLGPPV